MNWPDPILTDSGGFQVMSLAQLRKIDEDGVTFRSHIDGSRAPADAGALDRDPGPARRRHPDAARRMHRRCRPTRRGVARAMRAVAALGRALAQAPSASQPRARRCSASCRAATMPELRADSAEALVGIGFDGYAIGGLAVGEPQEVMLAMLDDGRAAAAGRQAALPDGRRHAGRHRRGGGARHRHVRLRDADARRPPRPGLHPASARSTCATPATPTIRARSTRQPVRPAARD